MSPSKTGDAGRRHDDCWPPDPANQAQGWALPTLHVTLSAVPVSDSLVRDRVRRWLQSLSWPQGQMGDVLLATSEAVSNAIEHAYHSRVPGLVELEGKLRATRGGRWLELRIRDYGSWRPVPAQDENRRRGIPLMHACMDEVKIDGTDHGTEIKLRSRIVPLVIATI
jgi:anti-sigma regulatory factor (Ser/Thr protein kinase)